MSSNPLQEDFTDNKKGLLAPASIIKSVSSGTSWANGEAPRAFYINSDGDYSFTDQAGNSATFAACQCLILPLESMASFDSGSDVIGLW